jgi:CDP-diacylglycerol--glycerol-3-phosphate 3-phosphatidyltransferase
MREAAIARPTTPSGEDVASQAEDIWNLPNSLTLLRIAAVPVLLLMPFLMDEWGSNLLAWVFIAAATTDLLDGWLARRGQQVTQVGKLLDPLADKMLVATSLIMLVAVGRIEIWASWMVVVIVGRELAVTGLRGIASAGGRVMAATWHGKAKAVSQNLAIGALLFHFETLGVPAHELGLVLLFIATLLTLWSGYVYFADYFRSIGIGRPAA